MNLDYAILLIDQMELFLLMILIVAGYCVLGGVLGLFNDMKDVLAILFPHFLVALSAAMVGAMIGFIAYVIIIDLRP